MAEASHAYWCHQPPQNLSPSGRGSSIRNSSREEGCVMLSCQPGALVTNMTDRKLGRLQVKLPVLPSGCGFTRYELFLEVYDLPGPLQVETGTQRCEANTLWRTHSTRDIHIEHCSGADVSCPSRSPLCSKVHSVDFKYVYPGWYRLMMIPHIQHSTRQPQRTYPILVLPTDTDYKKKLLVDLSVNASLQYRDDNHQIQVAFAFGADMEMLRVDRSHLSLKLLSHVDPQLGDASCYETGSEMGCCAFQGGSSNATLVNCTMYQNKTKPHCDVYNGEVRCTFFNMTQGNYCVVVSFEDDRCKDDTVWTTRPDRPCRWHARKEFRDDLPPAGSTVIDGPPHGVYMGVAVAALLLVIVVSVFIFVKQRTARRRMRNVAYEEQQVEQLNPHIQTHTHTQPHQFSFTEQLTLTSRPRPEVLLVYSRDSKPFMELVTALRRILENICKCQVYDYFDPELWNTVSEDPQGWVRTLVMNRQAKVVIVASEVGVLRHRAVLGDTKPDLVTYRQPHPFDHLFLYALKLLREGIDQDSYKHHFVVTFDGYTESNHLLEHFNPYTRFVLPKHLNKLFEHLHEHSTVHFDTGRKLEERYEVRQLRLQLEHLINLKLLAQSGLKAQKLYDW